MSKVLSQSPNAIRKRAARPTVAALWKRHIEDSLQLIPLITPLPSHAIEAAIESLTAEKVFTFVGYGVDPKGRGAIRYTNDKRRTGTLVRGKFTDVKFVALPCAMTKEEILASKFIAQVVPTGAAIAMAA